MKLNFAKVDTCLKDSDFYQKLLKEIKDTVFTFAISNDNNYEVLIVSESMFEIFEIPSKEITHHVVACIYDRIFVEDKILVAKSFQESRLNLKKWEIEFRVLLPKKGLSWLKISSKTELHADGKVIFYGTILDITDLKFEKYKLEFSDDRFQFALEASNTGVWDWDLRTNKVFYSSESLKILEQDSVDIFDNPERWDKIVHPDDLEKYYSTIHDHFDNKTPFYENIHRVLTSTGIYKWIMDRGKVIERDTAGKPLRVIGVHTDISSQKERELDLLRMMKLYSDQNSRLLNFSHIVSHNLNSHAGNIKLLLDIIDLEDNIFKKQEAFLHIRTVSNDLNNTILNLSKIIAIQNNSDILVEPLKLNTFLKNNNNIINLYKTDNKITIISNVSDDAIVNFNAAYLESVLLNFSTNAIKYAHPDRFPIIEFDFFIENNEKVLTVSDNGLGIDLDKYGHLLFGMYKTFHKNENAQGIGLYITKIQIEAMKGKISVKSKVGVGTTFKIIFDS
jgi:signal transduction histidine kinase|nr:PAS domain-containing protein [uncultured Flavobacterium sp.]